MHLHLYCCYTALASFAAAGVRALRVVGATTSNSNNHQHAHTHNRQRTHDPQVIQFKGRGPFDAAALEASLSVMSIADTLQSTAAIYLQGRE